MNIRKYFQFSLKDLLWVFVLAAVVACWWKDRTGLERERVSLEQSVVTRIAAADKSIAAADSAKEQYYSYGKNIIRLIDSHATSEELRRETDKWHEATGQTGQLLEKDKSELATDNIFLANRIRVLESELEAALRTKNRVIDAQIKAVLREVQALEDENKKLRLRVSDLEAELNEKNK